MCRSLLSLAVVLVAGLIAAPAASAQQSLNLYVGGFEARLLDARDGADVLSQNSGFLGPVNAPGGRIDRQFNHPTIGGEWLTGLGQHFEMGFGVGFYRRTVPTINTVFMDANGNELTQELALRIVPFTGTIRFLPAGHADAFQPYIGTGIGVLAWQYTETGQFVDDQNTIVDANRTASGGNAGPLVLVGVRGPVGPVRIGAEIRHQWATATLHSDQGFAGTTINLGGFSYLLMINLPF